MEMETSALRRKSHRRNAHAEDDVDVALGML